MKVPFVDLRRQHGPFEKQFTKLLQSTVSKNQFILGSPVEQFEASFAKSMHSRFAVGVASGTDALHLSLRALGIGAGDEVLVPAMTFAATALAVLYAGATPILVDVQPHNALIDLIDAEKAVSRKTRAIIPVHLYGQTCHMDNLRRFAKKHRLHIVEDACQAHGAQWRGRCVGSFGATGCFSFYPSKNLGALGDGGMVVTQDEKLYKRLLMLRNYGQPVRYRHEHLGFNSRLDGLQAAFLLAKLPHLHHWNSSRKRIAARYFQRLKNANLTFLLEKTPATDHVFHLFVVRTASREKLQTYLKGRGVETNIHYPIPLHEQGFMRETSSKIRHCAVAHSLSRDILSLPMFPELTEKEIDYVCQCITEFQE